MTCIDGSCVVGGVTLAFLPRSTSVFSRSRILCVFFLQQRRMTDLLMARLLVSLHFARVQWFNKSLLELVWRRENHAPGCQKAFVGFLAAFVPRSSEGVVQHVVHLGSVPSLRGARFSSGVCDPRPFRS